DHVADQLSAILAEMRMSTSKTLSSFCGRPYNNIFMPYPWNPQHAFNSVGEFLDHYLNIFLEFCGPEHVEDLLAPLPWNAPVHLVHGDLFPRNILVDGSRITAIIDWETAGFYPDFLEYGRTRCPEWSTPGWDYVLARIFPGPRREPEIGAISRIMSMVQYNRLY
ncbi:hypothetical protein B0H10DRAFT_1806876, partial [Mycena sp. CBHHK59/15]